MAALLTSPLLPDQVRVEGAEVKFRAVCALGWAIYKNLGEFRSLVSDMPEQLDLVHWIDIIEEKVIDKFTSAHSATWPQSVSSNLLHLAIGAEVSAFPPLAQFLTKLASEVTQPDALDTFAHLEEFNRAGFQSAQQLVCDPDWSSPRVQKRWSRAAPQKCRFGLDNQGNFKPVTANTKQEIELKVNAGDFEIRNALLFYLTLEFQMMHEYISHDVPIWKSGNVLEEQFLLALMFLYYREQGPRNGLVSLVREADERRGDAHRSVRQSILHELAPGQEAPLSKTLLTLAVLDDEEMALADKRKLLALLKKRVPLVSDARLRKAIRAWIAEGDPAVVLNRLQVALG